MLGELGETRGRAAELGAELCVARDEIVRLEEELEWAQVRLALTQP